MKNIDTRDFIDVPPDELLKMAYTKGWALSLIGLIIYAVLRMLGQRPSSYYGVCQYFSIGQGWGGFSAGWFFICSKTCSDYTKSHEVGHIIQNAMVGGLSMVVYTAGSVARYWKRKITHDDTPYDDWFFEGDATKFGELYVHKHKDKE